MIPLRLERYREVLGDTAPTSDGQKQASDEQARLTWRLKAIQKKKDRLVEAHVHEQTIDGKTFREHMDRLREEEAKMQRYGAELEDLDVGAVLAFAERTLCDLAGRWNSRNRSCFRLDRSDSR